MESKSKTGSAVKGAPITVSEEPKPKFKFKEIEVYPSRGFTTLPDEPIREEIRTRIGAFAIQGETRSFRSLSEEEITKYGLPILGVSVNASDYIERVNEFFDNYNIAFDSYNGSLKIRVPVDVKTGEVILNEDTAGHIVDIMKYRHIKACPRVAENAAQFDEASHMYYAYILDKKEIRDDRLKTKGVRKKAIGYYLELTTEKSNLNKLNWVLEIARRGIKTGSLEDPPSGYVPSVLEGVLNIEPLDPDDKELALEELSTKRPEAFIEVVEEPDLEYRALLERMIALGVLIRQGNVVMNGNDVVGGGDEEAIARMKTVEYEGTLVVLKQKIKNASKELV